MPGVTDEQTPLIRKAVKGDDFDIDQFVQHRPRLSSYPATSYTDEPSDKRTGSVQRVDGSETGTGDEVDSNATSKFVNISSAKFYLVYSTIILGYFVACFDTTLMASSHPVITSYFNAAEAASWLTTVFMITNSAFNPLWGRLSDTIGRKPVYLIVLLIFALTNLWCAVAQSIESVIAARAVCGLGAGGIMSIGLVIVNDLVRIEHRGTFISNVNITFGLGSASGAALGGLLCDKLGWRGAFAIQIPIIAFCALAAIFTVPKNLGPMLINKQTDSEMELGENPAWTALKHFDNLGVVSLVIAVTLVVLSLSLGGNMYPWSSPMVLSCLILGIIMCGVVILVENRAEQPIMPMRLLIRPPVANLTYANFLGAIASNTVLFNVPIWFQAVDLTSPTASGLRLAAPSIGSAIAGFVTGYVITYTRRMKPILIVGGIVYVGGSIMLCCLQRSFSPVLSIVMITPTPLGQGFIYPGTMMAAFAISDAADQAVVTTTLQLWRNLGIVIGVTVSSLVFQNMLKIKLEEYVHGPDAKKIIKIARDSIREVKRIPKEYREQVIRAYAVALKLSFITALVASVLMLILILPVKLPKLSRGKKATPAPAEG